MGHVSHPKVKDPLQISCVLVCRAVVKFEWTSTVEWSEWGSLDPSKRLWSEWCVTLERVHLDGIKSERGSRSSIEEQERCNGSRRSIVRPTRSVTKGWRGEYLLSRKWRPLSDKIHLYLTPRTVRSIRVCHLNEIIGMVYGIWSRCTLMKRDFDNKERFWVNLSHWIGGPNKSRTNGTPGRHCFSAHIGWHTW